jgi:hypothetical protein
MNFAVLTRRRPPPPMSSASCWPSKAALGQGRRRRFIDPSKPNRGSCSRPKVLFSYANL